VVVVEGKTEIAKVRTPGLAVNVQKGQTRRNSSRKGQFAQYVGCLGTVKRSGTRAKKMPQAKIWPPSCEAWSGVGEFLKILGHDAQRHAIDCKIGRTERAYPDDLRNCFANQKLSHHMN
jgi:hypothetical protein